MSSVPSLTIPDLTGRVILVTGGNSGLGFESCKQLLLANATVYMASRSQEKAMGAIDRLENLIPGCKSRLKFLQVDLSSVKKCKDAAAEFMRVESRLDVLLNNAGGMGLDYSITPEGTEISVAANHVGPFAFTQGLLPILIKTSEEPGSDVRIVNVSSGLAMRFKTTLDGVSSIETLNKAGGTTNSLLSKGSRYSLTKSYNALWTKQLQKTLKSTNILVVSLHPGIILTEGAKTGAGPGLLGRLILFIQKPLAVSVSDGVYNSMWLSTTPALKPGNNKREEVKGCFFGKNGVVLEAPYMNDEAIQSKLWEVTDSFVKRF